MTATTRIVAGLSVATILFTSFIPWISPFFPFFLYFVRCFIFSLSSFSVAFSLYFWLCSTSSGSLFRSVPSQIFSFTVIPNPDIISLINFHSHKGMVNASEHYPGTNGIIVHNAQLHVLESFEMRALPMLHFRIEVHSFIIRCAGFFFCPDFDTRKNANEQWARPGKEHESNEKRNRLFDVNWILIRTYSGISAATRRWKRKP